MIFLSSSIHDIDNLMDLLKPKYLHFANYPIKVKSSGKDDERYAERFKHNNSVPVSMQLFVYDDGL